MRRSPLMLALAGLALFGCESTPPSIAALTLAPSDSAGQIQDVQLARTRVAPPVPVLAVRPGSDPEQSALLLNQPGSGEITIQLGIGPQHFLFFAPISPDTRPYTLAIFLVGEATPALGCRVGSTAEFAAPSDGLFLANSGDAVAGHPALSVVRRGFRLRLTRCSWPVAGNLDVTGPWRLQPDNVADQVGVVGIEVTRES